ncbi:MAG TPA: fatty acid desaturase [Anaerolineales bacterium]|nr:fatty acid desaturase [Anaerolineales bacterium]
MENILNTPASTEDEYAGWREIVARYSRPDLWRSIWQIVNTLVPYFALWALMIYSVHISYWITLALSIPTAGFMVRTFIIFHDCGHGSFFKSQKANHVLGIITGILTFTPYFKWRHDHAIHHATSSDLDGRGVGDVKTMTVKEYLEAPWWKKVAYRTFRSPLVMFTIGSFLVFTVFSRFPVKGDARRERNSVLWTDLILAIMIGAMVWLLGWRTYLMVQLPVMIIGSSAGVWLFYVQHNFDPTYWERHSKWQFVKAGFEGSSFYKLPAILQWFSGNIGFHHIHHLSPKIPNYKLPKCYKENPVFHVRPMTIPASLSSLRMRLYDEERRIMVGWNALKRYYRKSIPA